MKILKKEERQIYLYNLKHKIDDNGILLKQCNICEEWFPCTEEYFYKNKSNHSDGLHPYCKQCSIDKFQKWNKANPGKNNENSKVYRSEHKEYLKNWHMLEHIRNKEIYKQRLSNWQKNNPEKLKLSNEEYSNKKHDISKQEWIDCKQYFGNSCAYCGIDEKDHKIKYNQQLHKEHVNCEGEGNLSNCVPSCRICNTSKHKDNMEVWYSKQIFFIQEKLDKIHKWINEDYKQYEEFKIILPYLIKRIKNSTGGNFHFELWSKDIKGNPLSCLGTEDKKKKLNIYIEKLLNVALIQ